MRVQNAFLSPFQSKPTPAGFSLGSPGPINIPQVPGNRAEVVQNHGARRAVGYSFSLKIKGGYIST